MSDDDPRDLVGDLCRLPNPEAIDRAEVINLGGVPGEPGSRGLSRWAGQPADTDVVDVAAGSGGVRSS